MHLNPDLIAGELNDTLQSMCDSVCSVLKGLDGRLAMQALLITCIVHQDINVHKIVPTLSGVNR